MLARSFSFGLRLFAVLVLVVGAASRAHAQTDGNVNPGANGVVIDAEGILRMRSVPDPGGKLHRQRVMAARVNLGPAAANSKMRKISLNRLEAAIRNLVAQSAPPTEEMRYLAGLTRVSYVFYLPETKDIVLAGPAEGWVADPLGRVCGMTSGRPVLELEDLVVALRAYAPGGPKTKAILCSIDPTAEGLKRMQDFLRSIGSRATPSDTDMIVNGLRTNLGMQDVRIAGVPSKTHFAQVMLEADYRMKLIGIGLEKPPVRLISYVDRANPAQVSRQALQRWYFVPDYQCMRVTADEHAMALIGDGVKLVGEDQVVDRQGGRKVAGRTSQASQQFVDGFTRKYAQLAAKLPVYAQLRNIIDLSVAAAFIQDHDYYRQAGWSMATFRDEAAVPVETHNTPLHVETVVASIWRKNRLMTPVGGGVTINPLKALEPANVLADEDGKIAEAKSSVSVKDLPVGTWWWD